MTDHSTILGVRIDPLSLVEVLTTIHRFTLHAKGSHHIVTVNSEFIMAARHNEAFKRALREADLAVADGAGVVLAARMLGQPVPPRIPGVDLVQLLAKQASMQGYRLYLLGGRDGVAHKTAAVLTDLNPGLQIVGIDEGSPTDAAVIKKITAAKPHVLLVAWGAPGQDVWINQHKHELKVPVMMGVGGTFDFLAGKQRRAPRLMRDLGLEWLWRLVLEPSRWKRQLALPHLFLLVLISKLGINI